jgi:hypothetical protein
MKESKKERRGKGAWREKQIGNRMNRSIDRGKSNYTVKVAKGQSRWERRWGRGKRRWRRGKNLEKR